jgi:hypothetical protein
MYKKFINSIQSRIEFCYNKDGENWANIGNIIEVMRNIKFRKFVFENCISISNILKEQFNDDSFIGMSYDEFEKAYLTASRNIEANTLITINPSIELTRNQIPSWLNESKIRELGWDNNSGYQTDKYRTRYFEYLEKVKGWKSDILEDVKNSSLKVLKKIGNPLENNAFFVRGMVMGSVQSGKTTNFNAVINSAVDLGYQLIIVFSGTIEDLRSQTFQRISNDVVGGWEEDASIRFQTGKEYKGVSNIYNFSANEKQINMITGPEKTGDFNAATASMRFDPNRFNIAVCKKNISIIRNLLLWLDQYPQARNLPTLIIDDECDNASLNNNGDDPEVIPSQINAGIRALLNMFYKKTYLGYTATPFANILQFDGAEATFNWTTRSNVQYSFNCCNQDLFPEDFIQLLSPPTNYVGIKDFFDTRDPNRKKIEGLIETIPIKEIIECFPFRVTELNGVISGTNSTDTTTRACKKDDPYPKFLPKSLKDAIKCYILSIAIRYSRKKEQEHFILNQKHQTMLIHISKYQQWIDRTKKLIIEYIESIEPETRTGNIQSPIYLEFESIWNNYFLTQIDNIKTQLNDLGRNDPYLTHRDFNDIRKYLPAAIKDIEVVAIHSNSDDNLMYKNNNGKKYIAIGGNALSRGFTLEGLSINYFIRGTNNADTLMQMGRWFGYRPGYLDACKLFASKESLRKFDTASLIIEDLENKLKEMIKDRKTPREFTIWIQDNPDVLRLTRPNLLRNLHALTLDFNDKLQQSTQFLMNKNKIEYFYNNFKNYIRSIDTKWEKKNSFIINSNINSEKVIEALNLKGLKEFLIDFNILGLENFIKKANEDNLLNKWTIAISINQKDKNTSINLNKEFKINLMHNAKLIKRSRANNDKRSIQLLLEDDIFKAIRSTIISPSDLGIIFSDQKNQEIKDEFFKNNPGKNTVPENIYRNNFKPEEGLLIFYLIDPKYIIDDINLIGEENLESFKNFIKRNDLEGLQTPIVGCAVGLPKIPQSNASNYVTRRLIKDVVEMNFEEKVKAANIIGEKIKNASNEKEIFAIVKTLELEIELDSNNYNLQEIKEIILVKYLSNGEN